MVGPSSGLRFGGQFARRADRTPWAKPVVDVQQSWLTRLAHGRASGYNEAGERSPFRGVQVMAITVEAVYENGVLKPSQPLPWKEGERVRIDVSSLDSPLLKAYGIMGFKGTAEEAEHLALDPEFLPEECR